MAATGRWKKEKGTALRTRFNAALTDKTRLVLTETALTAHALDDWVWRHPEPLPF
jgi:hypothetical protein